MVGRRMAYGCLMRAQWHLAGMQRYRNLGTLVVEVREVISVNVVEFYVSTVTTCGPGSGVSTVSVLPKLPPETPHLLLRHPSSAPPCFLQPAQ